MPDPFLISFTQESLNEAIDNVVKIAPEGVTLDPNKLQGRPHRVLLKNIVSYVAQQSASVPPVSADGVTWHIPPGRPTITTTTVSELQSEVDDNGTIIVIPAQTVTFPAAASGKKRKDAIVAYYSADPPFYSRVAGEEVDQYAIAPTPSIIPSALFVRWVDVTSSALSLPPVNAVKSLSFDGGTPELPDVNGNIDIKDFIDEFIQIQDSMDVDGTGTKVPTVDAVNAMSNNIALAASATGFLRTDDSFTMSYVSDSVLGISASQHGIVFKQYFESAVAPADAVKHLTARNIDINASSGAALGADKPSSGTNKVLYVGWQGSTDTIVFSSTSYVQSKTICQLGLIFVKNVAGTYTFTDTNRRFTNIPDVSAYSNLLTTTVGTTSNVVVAPASTNMTIKNTAGSVKGISVNWGGSNTDERTVASNATTTFTFLSPGDTNTIPLPSPTTTLVSTHYWNGSAMTALSANGNAQVMRVLMTNRGTFIIQPGETQYTTLAIAKDNALVQQYTNFIPKDTFVEIARIAVRKAASNLSDNGDAVFFIFGSGGGGSTASATFSSLGGAPTDNTLLAAELAKIGTLSSLTTTDKSNLVAAVNEVKGLVGSGSSTEVTLFLTPETSPQEFPVYGKFLSGTLAAFDGSSSGNYTFKWKADGGTFSSSIATIALLTTALSGLTDTSSTKIQVTSAYANASSIIIKWSR